MSNFSHPHGNVFYRRMGHPHPVIERARGVYLYDAEGKRYLDAAGGAVVVNVGHAVREVVEAMARQAQQVAFVHAPTFTTAAVEAYAQRLAQHLPIPAARCYLLQSGAEAVECALKFARQYHLAQGEGERWITISRWQSYHGATLGALAVGGRAALQEPYLPLLQQLPHIEPPYCYRCPFGLTYPDCDIRCAHRLEEVIRLIGPKGVSAFIAEPISGASLGAAVPPPEYWPIIRSICDRYGVLLIADEVMTGFGRTGEWFALRHWGVEPDVMAMAKGAAGGYAPLSITAVRGELVEAVRRGRCDFVHGGTFSHHPVGAAGGLAVLEYLEAHDLVSRSARIGRLLHEKLRAELGDHPYVGDIRGLGLLQGLEFVRDRAAKEPFPAHIGFHRRLADEALARGLLIYPAGGCVDGQRGDLALIAPPFVVTEAELDAIVRLLGEALDALTREIA